MVKKFQILETHNFLTIIYTFEIVVSAAVIGYQIMLQVEYINISINYECTTHSYIKKKVFQRYTIFHVIFLDKSSKRSLE